jgi:hypothetical protein
MAADQEYNRLYQTQNALRREGDRLGVSFFFVLFKIFFDALYLQVDERNAHDRIGKARALRDSLQEDLNSDMPVAVGGLEAAKEVCIGIEVMTPPADFLFGDLRKQSKRRSLFWLSSRCWCEERPKLTTRRNRFRISSRSSKFKLRSMKARELISR